MLQLEDFDYHLPSDLIAQNPPTRREDSRLCVREKSGKIIDSNFSNIVDMLPKDSILVLNNTKVFSSRLIGNLLSGGKAEIFLLSSPYNDSTNGSTRAFCLGRPMKKFKSGIKIYFTDGLTACIVDKTTENFLEVEFNFSLNEIFHWFEIHGSTPLPPYIKRDKDDSRLSTDRKRYQTVYAQHSGSVAAPTAGLHFTNEILKKIEDKGISIEHVTLHVGAGTFMPVKTNSIQDHKMHEEFFLIPAKTMINLEKAKEKNRKIIAVGTTAFRALESMATLSEKNFENSKNHCDKWNQTNLFIHPKTSKDFYRPWLVDALITNFHQPKSTLFMLICALIGYDNARSYYGRAVKERYRFFSYGDSNLLWL